MRALVAAFALALPAAALASTSFGHGTATISSAAGAQRVVLKVELARTQAERQQGLMNRRSLGAKAGMVFLYPEAHRGGYWMKDTLIPLDMIFVKKDMTVAGVVEAAEPLTLQSRSVGVPSMFVVEVNGGWAAEHGVTAGTQVRFEGVP
jgi:uncharacterized protein